MTLDERRAYAKEYYAQNKEKIKEMQKKYREEHKEGKAEYDKKRMENPEIKRKHYEAIVRYRKKLRKQKEEQK